MDPYIQNVNNLFQKEIINIPEFIIDTQESLEKDTSGKETQYPINTIISPLFYFFDRYLNENIGSVIGTLTKFIEITKINEIDGLTNDRIIHVSLLNHATIFNIFKYKSYNYLYYSNSGLGIENQLNNTDSTSCKLFLIHMPNIVDFDIILEKICKILTIIEQSPIDLFIGILSDSQIDKRDIIIQQLEFIINEIIDILPTFDANILNLEFLSIFYSRVIFDEDRNINNYYYLIYTFLNYLVSIEIMSEISFNELLLKSQSAIFKSHIQKLYINQDTGVKFSFMELYINSRNNYNRTVYNNLQLEMDQQAFRSDYIYKYFIDDIHIELDKYASVSDVFRFKRKDIILDLKPSGLYNYKQIGGSCTFYSYYNLVLNKLFLNNCDLYLSNKSEAVKNVVDPILNIHYIMLYSLCICNDDQYFEWDFSSNKIFHFNYLYNILIENNFEHEITNFYPSKSLLFFSKQPLIDTLLNTSVQGYLESIGVNRTIKSVIVEDTYSLMRELNDYLNSIINQIRNKKPINILDIQPILLTNRDNLIPLVLQILDIKCVKYIEVIYDIYLIYLWYFIQLYAHSDSQKVISIGSEKKIFNVLVPLYWSSNVDTSKCGSQIECRIKKCSYSTFYINFHQNIDFFLNKFTFVEQYNLSEMIGNNFIDRDLFKINGLLKFKYCGFIFIKKEVDKYNYYENMIYDSSIFTANNFINKSINDKTLSRLTSLYFRINYLVMNKEIDPFLKDKYMTQQKNIIDLIKDFIIQNINIEYDYEDFEQDLVHFLKKNEFNNIEDTYLIFILSNKKYLIINDIETCVNSIFYTYLNVMEKDTIIIKGRVPKEKLYMNIRHLLHGRNELLDFDNDLQNHSKWITDYDINLVDTNKFQINSQEYFVVKPEYYSPISKILSRFGCNSQNYYEFIILFPSGQIDSDCIEYNSKPHRLPYEWQQHFIPTDLSRFYYVRPYINKIEYTKPNFDTFKIKNLNGTNTQFNMFICIKKNKTIIELNFLENNLDVNNCFYHKNREKYKLDFNISLPFRALLSETTPYLCYKNRDNQVFIDIIHTNAYWYKSNSLKYINFWSNDNYVETIKNSEFKIINFELLNSWLFPKSNQFEPTIYLSIFDFYPTKRRLYFTKDELNKPVFIDDDETAQINDILKEIGQLLTTNLLYNKQFEKTFTEVIQEELTKDAEKEKVIESFLEQNRLCVTFHLTTEFLKRKDESIELFQKMLNSLEIKHDFNMFHLIIRNLSVVVKIMIINTMLHQLKLIDASKTTCWEIINFLNVIDNIIFTIEKLKMPSDNPFFLYEILFLLQCSYFYKKPQFEKYKLILNDMIIKKDDLTLHQFMMGKGKTSVLTPLLALSSNIKMGKIANIITTEHLKKNTIEYLSMLYTIFNLNYQVMTDYEYKNIWLNETDINLSATHASHSFFQSNSSKPVDIDVSPLVEINNISNYINIIDEFDLHHNYLQSMFNLVKKRQEISESLYNYVFDYIYSKINSSIPFIRQDIKEITNYSLFNTILDREYANAIKLRYNKDYGFAHLFDKTDILFEKDIRLCVPFSRKDTPLYHSNFSNIILTIILTIHYYITNNNQLDENYDYYLVVNNYKKIIDILPINFYEDWMLYLSTYDYLSLEKVKETLHTIYSNISYTHLYPTIIKKFLYVVNQSKLYYALEQYNVSFQDVIYNVYEQWQVGYTGTIYLNLNKYFANDKFVFRNKIEDFDEKIEVRLAIEAYGSPIDFNKNEVLTMNIDKINLVDDQISFIMGNGFNRGIVDLAGLFLDYKNRNIAEYISKLISKKRVVYLNDNHQGMEYSQIDNLDTKYTPFHEDNFYYYDQCHTIGTDLSQPNDGYVAIIMNNNTRWTEFAQGIFRFRKLNHGTYMKIIYIHRDNERFETPLTNKDIYRIIETNERTFQNNQELGIKFQLLKAMTRKISKNYLESRLLQEFILNEPLNIDYCINLIKENIINLNDIIEPTHKNELYIFIKNLYTSIISSNTEQLIQLVTGNECHQKQLKIDTSIERNIERNIVSENIILSLNRFIKDTYDIIVHLKCSYCFNKNAFPLFSNEYNALINEKKVYVSFNLFCFNNFIINKTTPLVFVEFADKILIEVSCVALDYYITKLPIYNFNGIILNQHLYNKLNTTNPFKLDIDYKIVHILNIENYINPIKDHNYIQITDEILTNVFSNLNKQTGKAFYSIYRSLIINENYFKISFSKMPLLRFFVETYREEEIIDISRDEDKPLKKSTDLCDKREHHRKYRIDNIYFNNLSNIYGIDLTIDKYVKVPRVNFDLVYNYLYDSLKI
jgi:hypothetical protein